MKKLFAAVLALMLALSCTFALAEDTVVTMTAKFDITIDLPEGYTMTKENMPIGEGIFAEFIPADPAAAVYDLVIMYSEEFGDYTLNDLTEDEFAQMEAMLTADFADAVITQPTTAVGTKLIQVDEQGSESDYGLVLTIYHGYFVQISVEKPEGQLTEADFQVAVDLLSSLAMVEI